MSTARCPDRMSTGTDRFSGIRRTAASTGRLRRAIVARGWTVTEFAQVARIYPGTLYRALTGRPTNDATAIRIFQTLEKRRPMDMDEL
jgi:predicted transcriptional regulator